MNEKMVRCGRCHEVFDANVGPCPKCGTTYQPPVAAPKVVEGSYVDLYAQTGFVALPEPSVAPISQRRQNQSPWIWVGAALIVLAVIAGIVFAAGTYGFANQSEGQRVVAQTPRPTPTPTLPPSITGLLAQLNDRNLSAHVVVSSRVQIAARVAKAAVTDLVSFDGVISGLDETGTYMHNGVTREFRLVDNLVYARVMPSGTWEVQASIPSYLIIAPLFNISKPEMMQLIGEETKNGQLLNHFQTTRWWAPDPSRLAMTDVPGLTSGLAPDVTVLDLWATADGVPVSATFSGINSASDGTRLVDIEVSYSFDQVGMPVSIGTPAPTAAPTKN